MLELQERARHVQHWLVEVSEEGCCIVEEPRKRFASLRDLVLATPALTTLYPDFPKEVALKLGANSDTKMEGREASGPPRPPPPLHTDAEKTPAQEVKRNGKASCAQSNNACKVDAGREVHLPTFSECQGSMFPQSMLQPNENLDETPAEELERTEEEAFLGNGSDAVSEENALPEDFETKQGRRSEETREESDDVVDAGADAVEMFLPLYAETQGTSPPQLMPPALKDFEASTPRVGEIGHGSKGTGHAEEASDYVPKMPIAASPKRLENPPASKCPSSGKGKEMLTTRLDPGRGEVTLKSDFHPLQVMVPNLEHAVYASIFVDNSASSTVIKDRMHIILPIVTCGPAGLTFAHPLRLRFHLCGTEDTRDSSDDGSTVSTCSGSVDRSSSGSGNGGCGHRLNDSYKVVMQKGSDTASKDWTVMDGTLVSEGDDLFLEANISHFCRFGLAQEVGRYEATSAGYIEADLARREKKRGFARFVNLSDRTATFYLQPKAFDTKRHESGGFSVLDKLSTSFSRRVERTALATETLLFAVTVQLGPNEFADGHIGESVGLQAAVAVTTSQHEMVGGWWRRVCVRKVSVWDNKSVEQKKALVLLNARLLPPKYPIYGHFVVDMADEAKANIAQKVYDAITKKQG